MRTAVEQVRHQDCIGEVVMVSVEMAGGDIGVECEILEVVKLAHGLYFRIRPVSGHRDTLVFKTVASGGGATGRQIASGRDVET